MRKLAGTITPCQSKAAARRLRALAAGGDEGRDHEHGDESAQGERVAQRQPRHRGAGLERLGRAQRPLDMRAPQRDRHAYPWSEPRSRRRSRLPADAAGRNCDRAGAGRRPCSARAAASSGAKAAAVSRKKTPRPMARPIGGSHSQSPSHDSARNRPITVAIDASAGHSRSQKIVQRARPSARASTSLPTRSAAAPGRRLAAVHGTVGQVGLQQRESADLDSSTQVDRCQRAKGRHPLIKTTTPAIWFRRRPIIHSHGGRRSSAIRSATSRRGRTSAHSPSRTSTSGTSARVL